MKNKSFFLVVLIAVVVIIGSLFLISSKSKKDTGTIVKKDTEAVATFKWQEGLSPALVMTANRDLALDAVEIYLDYEGAVINSVTNAEDLPAPSFMKVSTAKSQVVANYLISDPEGFVLKKDQSVTVLRLNIDETSIANGYKITMNPQSQLVESKSSKVLPFNNQDLIIKSTR